MQFKAKENFEYSVIVAWIYAAEMKQCVLASLFVTFVCFILQSMTREFQKCQDIESERIRVLLNALHEFARTVNIQSHGQQP